MTYFTHWSGKSSDRLNYLNSLSSEKTLLEKNRLNELDNLISSTEPMDMIQTLDDLFNHTLESGANTDQGKFNPEYLWILHCRINHIKEMLINIYQFEVEQKRKEVNS